MDEQNGQLNISNFLYKFKSNDARQNRYVESIAWNLVVDCDMLSSVVTKPGFLRHHELIDERYRSMERCVSMNYSY